MGVSLVSPTINIPLWVFCMYFQVVVIHSKTKSTLLKWSIVIAINTFHWKQSDWSAFLSAFMFCSWSSLHLFPPLTPPPFSTVSTFLNNTAAGEPPSLRDPEEGQLMQIYMHGYCQYPARCSGISLSFLMALLGMHRSVLLKALINPETMFFVAPVLFAVPCNYSDLDRTNDFVPFLN